MLALERRIWRMLPPPVNCSASCSYFVRATIWVCLGLAERGLILIMFISSKINGKNSWKMLVYIKFSVCSFFDSTKWNIKICFLILTEFQNYLRTQAGNNTTVNIVICTVDYLLRLQESMMDFYWHYSGKEIIDPSGKGNFCRAINVAKQVFRTLTEYIQVCNI